MLKKPNGAKGAKAARKPIYVHKRDLVRSLVALCVLVMVSAVMLAGLAMPLVGLAGLGARASTQAFQDIPDDFDPLPPSQQSVLYASDGSVLARFYAENRIVVPLKDMSPWVQKAAVAIEDRRFYQHKGVDIPGLIRAAINNALGSNTQGASTITQQYVKNTRIEIGLQRGDEQEIRDASAQTLTRKILEARYAVSLEKKMSKKKILEGYLNIAPFAPSVYGVEAASRFYFSKHAKDLDIGEAALLAGLTQSPVAFDPVVHPDKAQVRRDQVLFAMLNEKIITKKQYDEQKARKVKDMLKISHDHQGCQAAGSAAYFCEYVVSEIYNSENFGRTIAERRSLLTRGGLKIYSTLDPKKQADAQRAVEGGVPINDPSGAKAALSSVEPGTGKIVAMAQTTHYGSPTKDDPSATHTNFNADLAHGGGAGFQTGSSFKTITLATWFESGHSASERIPQNFHYRASDFHSSCPDKAMPAPWSYQNSEGSRPGSVSVLDGTKNSYNSVYAGMESRLDMCDILHMSEKLGAVPGDGSHPLFTPASILGANSVPPLYMANAYATLAAGGIYCTPIAITKVIDSRGKAIAPPSANCHRVIGQNVADKTMDVLRQTYNYYGGWTAFGREAATKSGTSDASANLWLAGTTPNLAAAVWVGHSDRNESLMGRTINGRYWAVPFGQYIAGPIWREYMRTATADMPVEHFQRP